MSEKKLKKLTFILGGASSGKSRYAESLLNIHAQAKLYVATAQIFDEETATKVRAHQADRDASWRTIETPFAPWDALAEARTDEAVLLDCATMWLTNMLLDERDIEAGTQSLLSAIDTCPAPVVIVSNEVGLGIVPENALARRFRIAQGALNQRLAARADTVIGVMAGLPFALKGEVL